MVSLLQERHHPTFNRVPDSEEIWIPELWVSNGKVNQWLSPKDVNCVQTFVMTCCHDLLSCNIICIWKMIKRWLDECQSNLLTYWWTNKLTGWLIGCFTDWLRDWLIDRLIDTLTDWLINYLIDWLLYCLIDCMMDWLMGWLTVCLINWMTEDWKTA